jgi:Flp pilus assembly protein TadD
MNQFRNPSPPATPYERFKAFCLNIKLRNVERELEAFERDRQALERVTRDAILRRASLASTLRGMPDGRSALHAVAPVLVLRPKARELHLISGQNHAC